MKRKMKYSCLEELQEQGRTGNVKSFGAKTLCESNLKVFEKAERFMKLGEDEDAYVLFWKFVELVKIIRSRQEYNADPTYFESMYSLKKKYKTAIKHLEKLTLSLEAEYEKAKLNGVPETTDKVSVEDVKIQEDKKNKKLQENIPNKAIETITCKDLYSLIQMKSTSFFLLDTRSSQDYQRSQINHPNSINIPENILRSGLTAHALGKQIKVQDRSQWERRGNVDKLIVLDWCSKDLESGTPVSNLQSALTQWDRDTTYRSTPVLLVGGFEMFRLTYPLLVTDPKYKMLGKQTDVANSANAINLDTIKFPELDQGFLTTPSPSPKSIAAINSGAIKISRGGQEVGLDQFKFDRESTALPVSYPSLTNLKTTPFIDRKTKPGTLSSRLNSQEVDDSLNSNAPGDDFNNARVSGISRIDSGSSIYNSTSSTSSLNNALLASNNGTTLSSLGSTLSSHGSSSTMSGSNFSEIFTKFVPKVDRSLKPTAEIIYSRAEKALDLSTVIEVQKDLTDLSVDRKRNDLQKELEWTKLCQKRESESSEEMRRMLEAESEKLLEHIEQLTLESRERDERERLLREQLKQKEAQLLTAMEKARLTEPNEPETETEETGLRREMEAKEVRQRREMEAEEVRLRREVEERRRARKMKEEERRKADRKREDDRRREEEQRKADRKREEDRRREEERRKIDEEKMRAAARESRKQQDEEYKRERLKDEGSGGGGGLRRSYSSPNVARMVEKEVGLPDSTYTIPVPKFDRQQKPSGIVKRDFAGLWGTNKPGITGLRNLGNTCYMNSILQCVSNTEPLVEYFVSGNFREDLNRYSETRGEVAEEFAALLTSLWTYQYKSISPTDIKATVGRFKREFAGRDQQDSHEFACKLLEWLHDDTNKIQKPSKMPEIETSGLTDVQAAAKFWKAFLDRNQSIIVQLFYGLTKQSTVCLGCQAKSIKFQEFYNLNLFIPNSNSKISLRDCLKNFVKENQIEYKCEKCRKSVGARQWMQIVRLPPLLIIHLERFYPDEQIFRSDEVKYRKKQNFVAFPLSNMNLEEFVSRSDSKYTSFNLYAVSNHFGSLEGGHYTASCFSKHSRRWYKYDDQDVSPIEDSSSVESSAAYILFYSALDSSNSLLPLG